VLGILSGQIAAASETTAVTWQTDVNRAWQATQRQGRPLLVFVTRDDCYYCTQMKEKTYANAVVAGAISRSYVPLVLDGSGNSQLLKDLQISSYPCTFVISPQAVVVDRIEGFMPPETFANRLHAHVPRAPVAKVVKDP
jgi:thioredoxin-related protein